MMSTANTNLEAVKVELALVAILQNKTMGQFLREVDSKKDMTKAELQSWAKAYDFARR